MRLVCKPLFTEAILFSTKIKVHRFISCKQVLKLTDDTNKARQSKLTVYWMKNINIEVEVYMNLFMKGTDLREVLNAFPPLLSLLSISSTCCQSVKFSMSAAFV